MFHRLSALYEAFTASNTLAGLLALSDRELAARGLSREGLTRSFISGLGAR